MASSLGWISLAYSCVPLGIILSRYSAATMARPKALALRLIDPKSTRLNSSHSQISDAVFYMIRRPSSTTLFPATTLCRSPGDGVVLQTLARLQVKASMTAKHGEFAGLDQLGVLMRPLGNHFEQVLSRHNGQTKGLGTAVDRGEEHPAPRLDQFGAGRDHGSGIGHMLEHLHAGHHVKGARLLLGQTFH